MSLHYYIAHLNHQDAVDQWELTWTTLTNDQWELTWTTLTMTTNESGRETMTRAMEPIVSSREQIPGPSSQAATTKHLEPFFPLFKSGKSWTHLLRHGLDNVSTSIHLQTASVAVLELTNGVLATILLLDGGHLVVVVEGRQHGLAILHVRSPGDWLLGEATIYTQACGH